MTATRAGWRLTGLAGRAGEMSGKGHGSMASSMTTSTVDDGGGIDR